MTAYVVKNAGGRKYVVFQSDGSGVDGLLIPGKWYAVPSGDSPGDKPLSGDKSPAADTPTPFDSATDADLYVQTLA
jgi:hypothetical protein